MRDDLLKNQALLAQRDGRVEKAANDRYGKALVYGLAALLAAAVIGLFYHAYRRSIALATPTGGTLITSLAHQQASGHQQGSGRHPGGGAANMPAAGAPQRTATEVKGSLLDGLKRAPRNPASESIPPLAARDRPHFSVSVPDALGQAQSG